MEQKKAGFAEQGESYIQALNAKIPPQDKESVDRVVVAGQKLMFSEQTHKYMLSSLLAEGDVADKLSVGMIRLVIVLLQQAKGNIPPNIMLPAASILLVKACQYVDKTQGGMDMEILSDANTMMITGIHQKVKESDQSKPQEAAPQQAPQPTPQQPKPQGLLNTGVA